MKEPKRYSCGNGEGMFEDDKNGHWVEYSEHKAIVEALTEQLRKHAVSGSLLPLDVHNKARELSAGEFIDWWFTKKQ